VAGPDVIDAIAGLGPESPVALLRRQREAFVRHAQGSHDVLLAPDDPGGLSVTERAAIALCVATMERDEALIAHYQARLESVGGVSARLDVILDHVRLVVGSPAAATRERLDALIAVGLAPRDIVAITQIVAFVSYQVRVVAGLRALAGDVPR
jgi:uncharacterized protein YciW